MVKTYLLLTKPGIIMGNAITTVAGFLLASKGQVDFGLFLATLAGLSLIIASACVFNNYIDRDIDALMARTKKRALVKGLISGQKAIIFATLLGLGGTAILGLYTNTLALFVALGGFFVYVVLYGFWKRRSVYGTVVGSISGAVPPVVGYVAVSSRLDAGTLIFFLILVLWQMPHFFAIAIYRFKDYKAAGIPVLPVKKGVLNTKINMMIYIVAFILLALSLAIFNYTVSYSYILVAILFGAAWLWRCIKGFSSNDDRLWAKGMFKLSLIVITLLSVTISLDAWLP